MTGVISDPRLVDGFRPVGAVNLSPAGRLVAVLVEDNEVRLFDAPVALGRQRLSEQGASLASLAWSSRSGELLVLRDAATGKPRVTLPPFQRSPDWTELALSAAGRVLVT